MNRINEAVEEVRETSRVTEAAKETNLFETLKDSCRDVWVEYTYPEFIDKLQDRSLSIESFRYYLKQDYLYLMHYVKCFALMAYKANSLEEMQFALRGTTWITEGELELHRQYENWGITTDELEVEEESIECIAYTRYMKDAGMTGDYLDLMVAIASCYTGYAEIGKRLIEDPNTDLEGHPYKEWIEMYGSANYQDSTQKFIGELNKYGSRINDEKLTKLKKIFKDVTRLEVAFWEMGLLPKNLKIKEDIRVKSS